MQFAPAHSCTLTNPTRTLGCRYVYRLGAPNWRVRCFQSLQSEAPQEASDRPGRIAVRRVPACRPSRRLGLARANLPIRLVMGRLVLGPHDFVRFHRSLTVAAPFRAELRP